MNETDALLKAIEIAGGQASLAAAAGVSQPAIAKAKKVGRVSPELAIAIERGLSGAISRAELRPDMFGSTNKSGAAA